MNTRSAAAPVIIIGGGAAGLSAALELAAHDVPVRVIGKDGIGDGSTVLAQGGLAAVQPPSGSRDPDSLDSHVEDTLIAGAGLCDPEAVRELAAGAPGAIDRLAARGARFDVDHRGRYRLGLEGGHSARRIVHAGGDASGAMVSATLQAAVTAAAAGGRITIEKLMVSGLLVSDRGAVCGVQTVDAQGTAGHLSARAVVLATGGIGQIWSATTNPGTATADGLALALGVGAVLRDLEFVQFHPTVIDLPGSPRALISEALRGEGARLIDERGTSIMQTIHPRGDLAPRDVVSAALQERITQGQQVWLDATVIAQVEQRFPTADRLCRGHGLRLSTDLIPVRPAEHFHCGGIRADLDGRTSVNGLYAVGEVAATGVHGANRLASNSLTEALIAGQRVGALLSAAAPDAESPVHGTAGIGLDPTALGSVQAIADSRVGVLRQADGLAQAITALEGITASGDGSRESLELANRRVVARAIAVAAQRRTESRGAHRRLDHPQPERDWQRHQDMVLQPDGELRDLSRVRQLIA